MCVGGESVRSVCVCVCEKNVTFKIIRTSTVTMTLFV